MLRAPPIGAASGPPPLSVIRLVAIAPDACRVSLTETIPRGATLARQEASGRPLHPASQIWSFFSLCPLARVSGLPQAASRALLLRANLLP
jgi:hypothetical protein